MLIVKPTTKPVKPASKNINLNQLVLMKKTSNLSNMDNETAKVTKKATIAKRKFT
jgi:hypothetical protein